MSRERSSDVRWTCRRGAAQVLFVCYLLSSTVIVVVVFRSYLVAVFFLVGGVVVNTIGETVQGMDEIGW